MSPTNTSYVRSTLILSRFRFANIRSKKDITASLKPKGYKEWLEDTGNRKLLCEEQNNRQHKPQLSLEHVFYFKKCYCKRFCKTFRDTTKIIKIVRWKHTSSNIKPKYFVCNDVFIFPNQYPVNKTFLTLKMSTSATVCQEKEGSVITLLRLQTVHGSWLWFHTVLVVRGSPLAPVSTVTNNNGTISTGLQTNGKESPPPQTEKRVKQLIHATYQLLRFINYCNYCRDKKSAVKVNATPSPKVVRYVPGLGWSPIWMCIGTSPQTQG